MYKCIMCVCVCVCARGYHRRRRPANNADAARTANIVADNAPLQQHHRRDRRTR